MKQLLNRLSFIGSQESLIFTSQEELSDCILGLDGIQKKLVVLHRAQDRGYQVINLDEVMSCSIKRSYSNINAGSLKEKRLDAYLRQIVLNLDFIQNRQPVEIPFFSNLENEYARLHLLEHKVKSWEMMVTMLLQSKFMKRA